VLPAEVILFSFRCVALLYVFITIQHFKYSKLNVQCPFMQESEIENSVLIVEH